MAMESKHELFEHELRDVYDAEHKQKAALKKLATQSKQDAALQELFSTHLQETEAQIQRLQEVFASVDKRARRQPCEGINGLLREHADFIKAAKPKGDVLRTFNIGSALKTEHYEIVSYKGLINLATELGNTEAVSLLQQTLAEEERAATLLEQQVKRVPVTPAE